MVYTWLWPVDPIQHVHVSLGPFGTPCYSSNGACRGPGLSLFPLSLHGRENRQAARVAGKLEDA
jgi:hypothetical protein